MQILTVKEAVDRVENGEDLKGVVLDKASMLQVNVRDAMVLSRGGIVVPEENLYYDDDDIAYDEEIDELVIGEEITHLSWKEKAERFEKFREKKRVSIAIAAEDAEFVKWMEGNKDKLSMLLEPIVVNLFRAEKVIKKGASGHG